MRCRSGPCGEVCDRGARGGRRVSGIHGVLGEANVAWVDGVSAIALFEKKKTHKNTKERKKMDRYSKTRWCLQRLVCPVSWLNEGGAGTRWFTIRWFKRLGFIGCQGIGLQVNGKDEPSSGIENGVFVTERRSSCKSERKTFWVGYIKRYYR